MQKSIQLIRSAYEAIGIQTAFVIQTGRHEALKQVKKYIRFAMKEKS